MICCIPPTAQAQPFLSICIPTWNCSEKLRQQLARLVPHLSAEIEIVIVDNGSEDDTLDAVRRIAADHPQARISLWSNEVNLGADVNYLRALELASGEWLWLLGDDEDIDPSRLPAFIAALRPCGDVAMLYLREWEIAGFQPPASLDAQRFLAPELDMLGYAILKIGLFVLRRSATLPMLKRAYQEGIGDLHSYAGISLGLLDAGAPLSVIEVAGLFVHPQPAAHETGEPKPVRWNALRGELGAWRATESALARYRERARAREVRLRLRSVYFSLLQQIAAARGDPRKDAAWTLRAAPLQDKPTGLAVVILALLPRPIGSAITKWLLVRSGRPLAPHDPDQY